MTTFTKNEDIEEFNIESYQVLCYSVKVTDIEWDLDDDDFEGDNGVPNEVEKHYWILPTDLEAQSLEEAKEEIEEIISNRLSDEEGFCHNGFNIEIKEPFNKAYAKYLYPNDENNLK